MNRINLVTVGVEDMSRSLTFYKAIGFQTPETSESPPIVFFDNEGSKLELFPLNELQKDIDPDDPPEKSRGSFSGITFACNMKSEREVDDMMKRVEEAGGDVVKDPQPVYWVATVAISEILMGITGNWPMPQTGSLMTGIC
ncbi:hypothetical protein SAMN04488100_1365 [Alkalibacterium putridalgicola]|uniref:Glyoxalase n=1 Tax=Alkalibacterium putridalgicola TaxID=426703 RepID=A0A1H7WL51_9LACT|nr:VOC family protein [Alkalibacterium putridalgicola]GEK90094.1 glyoxalase [Alkalibacterium putridalgicola]SEM22306.1 hypothetical protein SAMN04488100_1365 [Alkalibacterium putridalgicola]